MINEDRVPFFRRVALFDIFIRLEAVTSRHSAHLHIKLAVLKEHIGMTDRDFRVLCAFENVFAEARHILTEVDGVAVFRFPYFLRRKALVYFYRRHFHCPQNSAGALYDFRALPF